MTGGNSNSIDENPQKKTIFRWKNYNTGDETSWLLNFHVLVDDIAKLDLFGCTIRGISIAKPLWLLFERGRERELFKLLTHVASFLFLVPKHKERPPEPDFDFSYEGAAASSSAGGDAQPWQNNR